MDLFRKDIQISALSLIFGGSPLIWLPLINPSHFFFSVFFWTCVFLLPLHCMWRLWDEILLVLVSCAPRPLWPTVSLSTMITSSVAVRMALCGFLTLRTFTLWLHSRNHTFWERTLPASRRPGRKRLGNPMQFCFSPYENVLCSISLCVCLQGQECLDWVIFSIVWTS